MALPQAKKGRFFSQRTMIVLIAFIVGTKSAIALASPKGSTGSTSVINLQLPHSKRSPEETLQNLAEKCNTLGIHTFDVYGDFDKTSDDDDEGSSSFLKRFEAEIAEEMGMEDAVFMPSGGMAQSIALLIHNNNGNGRRGRKEEEETGNKSYFACHETSHLLLHEREAYRELLQMEPIVISTAQKAEGISIPPMMFEDVEQACNQHFDSTSQQKGKISTLMLELPHREIGGKLTPWEDVLRMQQYCQQRGIKFHLDGARIFEATTGYDNLSLKDMSSPFDSVYISFYKGLGGISGAMLLGTKEFCDEARVWLRRFGGNLYTLLPYAVSGWAGYRQQWKLEGADENINPSLLSFQQKKEKLVHLVKILAEESNIVKLVTFDPAIPETNMIHGYIRASPEDCAEMLDAVERRANIRVLSRVRPVSEEEPAYQHGFRSKFEWPVGESNVGIADDTFLQGWKEFSMGLLQKERSSMALDETAK